MYLFFYFLSWLKTKIRICRHYIGIIRSNWNINFATNFKATLKFGTILRIWFRISPFSSTFPLWVCKPPTPGSAEKWRTRRRPLGWRRRQKQDLRTDVMIFKIFSSKNSAKKLAFLTQNKAKLCKMLIITLFFLEKRQIFRQKLSKIAEYCHHNIDPCSLIFKSVHLRLAKNGRVFLWQNCIIHD
jgi:hypothetical protein